LQNEVAFVDVRKGAVLGQYVPRDQVGRRALDMHMSAAQQRRARLPQPR
jgi:hypothetical protein